MTLKLFHKLFLLVAVTALVASLAMATVMAWNLSRGFADYLDARDAETIDAYVSLLSQKLEERGGVAALKAGQVTLKNLHEDLIRDSFIAGGAPDFRAGGRWPDRPPLRYPRNRMDQLPPPLNSGGPPIFIAPRMLVFDASGTQIAGPPPPPEDGPQMTVRRIRLNGETIGSAKIIPHAPAPDGVDTRFLRSQYISAALLVAALMIFAALAAWGFARAGTRRLATMEAATKEIANGNFAVRTDAAGADEISSMGQNINQMAESLARADQARRGWLAEIGHELRTPLTVLSGELEALKDGIRPLDQNAISSLQEETDRLGDLIEDLHFMAVSDLTNAPHKFGPEDAVKLVGEMTERFRPLLSKAGLNLDVDLGGKAALPVVWDGKRIEQLLGNLLTNSLRYTDAPGSVHVSLKNASDRVIIAVEDSAPGVPADALPRLFEPLFRVDEARDRSSGGSGLGLAVCRTIVEAHGGRIAAKNSDLGGLLIELNLPQETSRA
jgi:two-component system sensor histidine kinase BaeS